MAALTDSQVAHLLQFIGYGNPHGPVWFLGMEEGGGGEANLRARLEFSQIEDLAEAHAKLGILKHHSGARVIQPTWRGMCAIMLALAGETPSREAIRHYQATRLGRRAADTFLLELMPLPKHNSAEWQYSSILPGLPTRAEYFRQVQPPRIFQLRQFISEHRPATLIGYGKAFWESYVALLPERSFQSNGPFLVSGERPFVLLCDHLTARTMNGKFNQIAALIHPHVSNASAYR